MSALGQKQTCAAQKVMSALPPKADMCGALAYVCFVPKADIHLRGYFARFHTNSSVTPAGVRGFVNFISSAVMDEIMRRWLGAP